MGLQDVVPIAEVRVGHSIGKPSHADPDALKDTIAGQLMQDQARVDLGPIL